METKQLMNDSQTAVYDMVSALLALFLRSMEIISGIPALGAAITQLTAAKVAISEIAVTRDQKKSSIKKVKVNSRSNIGTYIFKYSRKLRAYGKVANIAELINLSSLPPSMIDHTRFSNIAEYADEVLKYLKKYALELADQKVTPEMIDAFEALILEYKTTLSGVDSTHGQAVGETADLVASFALLMSKLYIIDDMVDGIRDEYPVFCNEYDAIREVHYYGIRHRTPEEAALLKAKADEKKAQKALAKKEKAAKAKAKKLEILAGIKSSGSNPGKEIS